MQRLFQKLLQKQFLKQLRQPFQQLLQQKFQKLLLQLLLKMFGHITNQITPIEIKSKSNDTFPNLIFCTQIK